VDLGTTGLVFREEFDFGRVALLQAQSENAPLPAQVYRGERRGRGAVVVFRRGFQQVHTSPIARRERVCLNTGTLRIRKPKNRKWEIGGRPCAMGCVRHVDV